MLFNSLYCCLLLIFPLHLGKSQDPPTLCEESDDKPYYHYVVTTSGNTTQVSLCAYGYPVPDGSTPSLQKDNNGTWIPYNSTNNVIIEISTSDGILRNVNVTFPVTNVTHEGKYRLRVPQRGRLGFSYLHFQLLGSHNGEHVLVKNLNDGDIRRKIIHSSKTKKRKNSNSKSNNNSKKNGDNTAAKTSTINTTTVVGIVVPLVAILVLFVVAKVVRARRLGSNSTKSTTGPQ